MEIKTLQWNIGAARLRDQDANPTAFDSYARGREDIHVIADVIKEQAPDLVTLQETHADSSRVQAQALSELTGLNYWVNDEYDDSHLKHGQRLGQAVLSHFPIVSHRFDFFINPKLEMTAPDGKTRWQMHNKGVTTVTFDMEGRKLELKTLHVFPYRKFGSDPLSDEPLVKASRESISGRLKSVAEHLLIQGDFNYDGESLRSFLPRLFESGMEEVLQTEPTTPKGRRYDHVLYRGMKILSSRVLKDVLTDHYPIISVMRTLSPNR